MPTPISPSVVSSSSVTPIDITPPSLSKTSEVIDVDKSSQPETKISTAAVQIRPDANKPSTPTAYFIHMEDSPCSNDSGTSATTPNISALIPPFTEEHRRRAISRRKETGERLFPATASMKASKLGYSRNGSSTPTMGFEHSDFLPHNGGVRFNDDDPLWVQSFGCEMSERTAQSLPVDRNVSFSSLLQPPVISSAKYGSSMASSALLEEGRGGVGGVSTTPKPIEDDTSELDNGSRMMAISENLRRQASIELFHHHTNKSDRYITPVSSSQFGAMAGGHGHNSGNVDSVPGVFATDRSYSESKSTTSSSDSKLRDIRARVLDKRNRKERKAVARTYESTYGNGEKTYCIDQALRDVLGVDCVTSTSNSCCTLNSQISTASSQSQSNVMSSSHTASVTSFSSNTNDNTDISTSMSTNGHSKKSNSQRNNNKQTNKFATKSNSKKDTKNTTVTNVVATETTIKVLRNSSSQKLSHDLKKKGNKSGESINDSPPTNDKFLNDESDTKNGSSVVMSENNSTDGTTTGVAVDAQESTDEGFNETDSVTADIPIPLIAAVESSASTIDESMLGLHQSINIDDSGFSSLKSNSYSTKSNKGDEYDEDVYEQKNELEKTQNSSTTFTKVVHGKKHNKQQNSQNNHHHNGTKANHPNHFSYKGPAGQQYAFGSSNKNGPSGQRPYSTHQQQGSKDHNRFSRSGPVDGSVAHNNNPTRASNHAAGLQQHFRPHPRSNGNNTNKSGDYHHKFNLPPRFAKQKSVESSSKKSVGVVVEQFPQSSLNTYSAAVANQHSDTFKSGPKTLPCGNGHHGTQAVHLNTFKNGSKTLPCRSLPVPSHAESQALRLDTRKDVFGSSKPLLCSAYTSNQEVKAVHLDIFEKGTEGPETPPCCTPEYYNENCSSAVTYATSVQNEQSGPNTRPCGTLADEMTGNCVNGVVVDKSYVKSFASKGVQVCVELDDTRGVYSSCEENCPPVENDNSPDSVNGDAMNNHSHSNENQQSTNESFREYSQRQKTAIVDSNILDAEKRDKAKEVTVTTDFDHPINISDFPPLCSSSITKGYYYAGSNPLGGDRNQTCTETTNPVSTELVDDLEEVVTEYRSDNISVINQVEGPSINGTIQKDANNFVASDSVRSAEEDLTAVAHAPANINISMDDSAIVSYSSLKGSPSTGIIQKHEATKTLENVKCSENHLTLISLIFERWCNFECRSHVQDSSRSVSGLSSEDCLAR